MNSWQFKSIIFRFFSRFSGFRYIINIFDLIIILIDWTFFFFTFIFIFTIFLSVTISLIFIWTNVECDFLFDRHGWVYIYFIRWPVFINWPLFPLGSTTCFFIFWLDVNVLGVIFLVDSAWRLEVFVDTAFGVIDAGQCTCVGFDQWIFMGSDSAAQPFDFFEVVVSRFGQVVRQ